MAHVETRREFLVQAAGTAAACCGLAALGGCRALNAAATPLARTTEDLVAAVEGAPRGYPLVRPDALPVGGQLKVAGPELPEPVLVVRTGAGDTEVHAVSIACTHWGSEVGLAPAGGFLTCPSHGSEFGLDGAVRHGPAKTPLARYTVARRTVDGKDMLFLELPPA